MSNFPISLDDDITLPIINDNITEVGGIAINSLRDAVVALEQNIGFTAAGSTLSLSDRLGIAIAADGQIKASALTSLGLVTLPITNTEISPTAQIEESKLSLTYGTQDLFDKIQQFSSKINTALGWISVTGVKLDPHLSGAIYRHNLSQIDIVGNSGNLYLNNKFNLLRNSLNSYTLVRDMNDELLAHQFADGSAIISSANVTTNNGYTYPSTHAHTASGIYLNTSRFTTVPTTYTDVQQFADYVDASSTFLLGERITNLYSNGISKVSFSSSLSDDGYGHSIIPYTSIIAYSQNLGNSSTPFDDIDTGDDIIEFIPAPADVSNNSFDAKFALVKVGDIIRINYDGSAILSFLVKEKKYILTTKKYVIRIAGKNIMYAPTATARIDRSLVNNNKYGVLSVSAANNNFSGMPSLIVASPRGGEALGVGFNPNQFDETHYLLYLALYPTGLPQDAIALPAIDVTGNQGRTPGLYTLDSIVEATNNAFRQPGYNYRFVAFSYKGEFGIMLADSYNNAAYSIFSGIVISGVFNQAATDIAYPNNVVGLFTTVGSVAKDPLGFGPNGANIASPPYSTSYDSPESSQSPTKLYAPLSRNNYYVSGSERNRFNIDIGQIKDSYGDGYWIAKIINRTTPAGRVEVIYSVSSDIAGDLSPSKLKIGKTLVAQSFGEGGTVDFGRFTIKNINYNCFPNNSTEITVYDAIHAQGFSPTTSLAIDGYVALYFNSDSVSFNAESATDFNSVSSFKRHFEVYTDKDGNTFTHERGRISATGSSITVNTVTLLASTELSKLDILKISPKLRGYQFGTVNKITLHLVSLNSTSGIYSGYLASYDGVTYTHAGSTVYGKLGEVTRFYDETNIDYIDVIFDIGTTLSTVSNQNIDFQLFPSLSLDGELLLIGTCQLNGSTNYVSRLRDERQFGNISEKELSTSALNLIALPEKLLHFNGVIKGFDIVEMNQEYITINGGTALVNGKIQNINNELFTIPKVKEYYSPSYYNVNWILCVNSNGELIIIPMTNYDFILGTPSNTARIFNAYNVVTANFYNIDSGTFSDILNNRKDLTPLYIISSTISGITVSLSKTDIRRFVNDQDSNIQAVVCDSNSQCNFKGFNSALAWVKLNNTYQNTIQIKGTAYTSIDPNIESGNSVNIISAAYNASLEFDNTANIHNTNFIGLTISFNSGVVLNNVSFTDCEVSFASTLDMTDCRINNCKTFIISGAATFSYTQFDNSSMNLSSLPSCENSNFNNCVLNISGITSLKNVNISNSTSVLYSNFEIIENCNFNNYTFSVAGATTTTTTTKTILFSKCVGTFTGTVNLTDIKFDDCNLIFTGFATLDTIKFEDCILTFTAGGIFTNVFIDPSTVNIDGEINVSSTTIIDSIVNINTSKAFTLQSNFRFENNTVAYSYNNPQSLVGYVPSDLVNATSGMMYANTSSELSNLIIRDNIFNTSMSDRLSFISLQLNSKSSVVRDINIYNNKFNNSNVATYDIRAVISIVSTVDSFATENEFPRAPLLSNVFIDKNRCNHDQMILVSAHRTPAMGSDFKNASLLSTYNTKITNNICGTIGFITGNNFIYNNNAVPASASQNRDKLEQIVIDGNTCKLIANLDGYGDYIPFTTPIPGGMDVLPGIGSFIISHNITNWISVGIRDGRGVSGASATIKSSAIISNNTLCPIISTHLNSFSYGAVIVPDIGIALKGAVSVADDTSNIISENIIYEKTSFNQSDNTKSDYHYSIAAISCLTNANIFGNIVKGAISSVSAPILALGDLGNIIVKNNDFNRKSYNIQAYVLGIITATNKVTITDNIFDSQYIDGSTETVGVNIPDAWIFNKNKNQICYKAISLAEYFHVSNNTVVPTKGVFLAIEPDHTFTSSPSVTCVERLYMNNTDPSSASKAGYYDFIINLETVLPSNVDILYLMIGLSFTTRVDVSQGLVLNNPSYTTEFNMDISKTINPIFNPLSPAGSLSDVWSSWNPAHVLIGGVPFASSTPIVVMSTASVTDMTNPTSKYLKVDMSSNPLNIGNGNQIKARIQYKVYVNLNSEVYLYNSPLSVKYRW